jgi:NNP family nitrate/nitrite transporter-like MFS transporter
MTDKACPTPEPFSAVVGTIIFLTLLFFLTFISRFIFAPLMPAIGQDLGLSPSQAGSIFLVGSIGVLIASFLSGFLSSRINHRGSLILSLFITGLGLLLCTFASSLQWIQMVVFFIGIAAGINLPSNIATITAMVTPQDWGKALAVQQLGPPMSLVLGPLLSVAFLTWFSWRTALMSIGVLCILVAFAFIRFGKCGDFPGDAPKPSLVRELISTKPFWVMVVLFAFAMGGQVGVYTMLPLYLVTDHGLDRDFANTLVGLSQISGLFMTFVAGWVTDKIGEKKAMAIFLIVAGIATVLLGGLSGTWLKVIIFIQPALGVCFFPAAFSALSRIVQPNMRSIAAGFAPPTAFLLGGGLFPVALGYMGQAYSFGLGIVLAGCIMTAGSVLVFFIRLLEKMEDGC